MVSHKFGAQEVTLFGLYFFRTRSQGVTALVSESDTNPNNKSDDETSRLVYSANASNPWHFGVVGGKGGHVVCKEFAKVSWI